MAHEGFEDFRKRFSEVFGSDIILAVAKYHNYRRQYDLIEARLNRVARLDIGLLGQVLGDPEKLARLAWKRAEEVEQYKSALAKANAELLSTLNPNARRVALDYGKDRAVIDEY